LALLRAENARLRDQLEVERRRLARERYEACHDVLTGLPNRRDLYERFDDLPAGRGLVAMMLDLDGFKAVNDDVGHRAGDRVLVEVGRRLWDRLAGRWLVARLGGDEFTAVRAGPVHEPGLLAQATALATVIGLPVPVADQVVRVGCSIGLAATGAPLPLPDLLGRADAALARSKTTGGPVLWHPHLDDDSPPRRAGMRPVVRTRDLRRDRFGEVSLLARVPAPREGVR
jgi:diguanylate cyclase (GGDEF)-like protein